MSSLYAFVAGRRMKSARREKMDAPVLCVGNFTVGGTGKTPIAIALARQAKRMQLVPGFLSRGHGGSFAEPHVVDTHHDSAKHVGDEPLLLAEHALVAVSANRAAGARLLIERGCNFLIMDDGFQSARIHIDYALIVVDARFGLGNGHVIPGGPMRARLIDQLRFADAILKMGEGERADPIVRQAARAGKPVFSATARPRGKKAFAGRRFLAFAGIGHPEKFFDTVGKAGGTVVLAHAFADHHFYLPDELDDLVAAADAGELELLTTSKDAARLRHGAASPEFLERLNVLEIDAVFDIELSAERIVDETLDAWRRRKIAG
ncbi:tetraacyldisaccharide 4'-kinase [Aminobacter niigataensis]|uniref:Tetraacyldisaccharide 4'-kinase n=1 Tax=Aminobacter niigataensis TaxID=83265 RepID=A0ABR6KZU0_9HYPH|nr:tetraacyldisaccharide 4'-kinase [Aminobacter niigataensis]